MGDTEGTETVEVEVHNESEPGFVFETFVTVNGLNRNTAKILRKEDLVNEETLCMLDNPDILSLSLSLGQRKLLAAAVGKLRPVVSVSGASSSSQATDEHTRSPMASKSAEQQAASTAAPSVNTPSCVNRDVTSRNVQQQSCILSDAGKQFDALFQDLSSEHSPANALPKTINYPTTSPADVSSPSPINNPCDPRSTLTVKAHKKKAQHITSFLSDQAKQRRKSKRRDLVLARNSDGEPLDTLMVQTDDSHPYHGIHISEWAAANCRLMNYLLCSNELCRADIEYYLAYTAMIMDLASSYEWPNVLNFDYNYREQQAEHSFQWGYINPMMRMQFLTQPRLIGGAGTSGNRRPAASGSRAQRGTSGLREECRQWKSNNGFCNYGDQCRYEHIPLINARAPPRADISNQAPKNFQRPLGPPFPGH